ncbi:type IV toxin-antitoxin system AbiEi family antitoxin domain-containing protein [Cellulomonas sp. A375-1]|uniref:type IV toxin-antitoxin system AbiEi family antitoxin domain-containing protein n=1 Tax=Cellulomonas sp. A375-1 TaxID=1672219 RepID=UPI00069F31A6|nr:type IV toxin-antitoxin system AbiEi family antitoxin domain-containing protein [Cellulomonas sp. A375-1]
MRPIVVPAELVGLALQQEGLVSHTQCDAHGLGRDTRTRLVASGQWHRATRGVYDTTPGQEPSHPGRRRRAVWLGMLAYGPDAMAVGVGALALHGVQGLPMHPRPEAGLPDGSPRHARDGVRLRCFDPVVTVELGGRRIATLADALVRALPELPRRNGLAVMDDVVHRGLLSSDEVASLPARMGGRRGVQRVRTWWPFVDGRAESPFESFARLECIDDGVPPDVLQLEIVPPDQGGTLRGDMGWRLKGGRWLVAELDGDEFHTSPDAVLADRQRQNRIATVGWVYLLRFAWPDLGTMTIPRQIRRALAYHR